MRNYVNFCYDKNTTENKVKLSYKQFWNVDDQAFGDKRSAVKETCVVIFPSRDKWKNDIKWFYPEDKYTHKLFLITRLCAVQLVMITSSFFVISQFFPILNL